MVSSFSNSFILSAIRICGQSMLIAAIIAFRFPFAPAWASPLSSPKIIMFSPAITSAPAFTSPKITILPSNSTFFPQRREPL